MLYNGANGSVKGLQAAMLNDGTAMAVYTLDRNTEASNGSGQEIGYTIVDKNGNLALPCWSPAIKLWTRTPRWRHSPCI